MRENVGGVSLGVVHCLMAACAVFRRMEVYVDGCWLPRSTFKRLKRELPAGRVGYSVDTDGGYAVLQTAAGDLRVEPHDSDGVAWAFASRRGLLAGLAPDDETAN